MNNITIRQYGAQRDDDTAFLQYCIDEGVRPDPRRYFIRGTLHVPRHRTIDWPGVIIEAIGDKAVIHTEITPHDYLP